MAQPCGSGECNIWTRRRLLESLPKEAPTRRLVAPPEVPEERYVAPAAMAAAGVAVCLAGGMAILAGLILVAVGVALAVRIRRSVVQAQEALADWQQSRWCVSCDSPLDPPRAYEQA